MDTNWRVVKVTATEGRAIAELVRVEWFKRNPAYDAFMAEAKRIANEDGEEAAVVWENAQPTLEEFAEASPGEEGAEFIETGNDRMSIDVYDELDLQPGDDVMVNLFHIERVDA